MKKQRLLKTLLVAASLFTGVSAWADAGDVTTNADIDFSGSITGTNPYTITGTVGSMTWTQQWTMAPNITDGILRFGNFNGGVVELQNNTIKNKDIVTIKFEMAFGKVTGKHVGFDLKDTEGNTILTQWFDAYNGDFDDANPLGLNWDKMYRGSNTVIQERCVYFTITLNYAANTITTNTKCYLSGIGKAATDGEFVVALPSAKPLGSFVLQGNINNADRYSTFDNLKITTTEGDYTVASAGYTINWKCGDDIVKTDATRSGDVDAAISLLPADIANFTESEQRYIYVDDDASTKTIADDGSTVVTVNVRKAVKYSYTITSSYSGNTLAWSTSGSVWEDQNTVNYQIPRFQAYNDATLVEAPYGSNGDLGKSVTVTSDAFVSDVEYNATSITNLFLLSEAENLGTGIATNGTTFTSRVSNSAIIFAASGKLLSLAPGKYIFTLGVIGGDAGSHNVAYTVSAGASEIISGNCTGNALTKLVSSEFTLYETTDITFTCSDPASSRGIDLVYVQKTGDITEVPITITAAGMATYVPGVNLDFTGTDIAAYTAEVTAKGVCTLTEIKKVPAGTPVLLIGTTDDIPVAATTDAVGTNNLVAGTGAAVATTDGEGNTNMILNNIGGNVGFYFAAGQTVATNRAYLHFASTLAPDAVVGGSRMTMVFGDDMTTGINAVESAKTIDGIYNLAGQRVAQPTRGLYIMNGKKFVVK